MPDPIHPSAVAQAAQLYQAGNLPAAEAACRQILAGQPSNADAINLLGLIVHHAGQFDQSLQLLRRAIELQPGVVEYHINYGMTLATRGAFDQAIEVLRNALRLQPGHALVHLNLGNLHFAKGDLPAAVAEFEAAVRANPNSSDLHAALGNALVAQANLTAAEASYRLAIQLNPSEISARINLGALLRQLRRHDEALAILTQALQLNPNSAEAYHNLGNVLREQTRLDEAAIAFDRALKLNPSQPQTFNSLGELRRDQGQIEQAVACFREAVNRAPHYIQAHDNLLYNLYFHPDYDSRSIYLEHLRWRERFADPLRQFVQSHTNDRAPDRRLRIGYVSPDFRDHVVGRNLVPLLRNHDRNRFEIVCYSNTIHPDSLTDLMRAAVDVWRDTASLNDSQLTDLIRQDRIDILVDLSLHMAHNRLLVFARKPAPIQISFAGYPGTTGLDAIDYRLTDPFLDPAGGDETVYSEKSIRLSDSFWCFDPLTETPAVNPLPASSNGFVTFGCLNNFCKVNEPVLELWARVLQGVPDSQLILLADPGAHRDRILRSIQRQGIDAARRVDFVPKAPRVKYLEYFHRFDIALDTFPYNGHTTSLDGLWMGVPPVSLVGSTVVGRAGLSQLSNLSLTELIATNKNEFVRIATECANDIPRLGTLRSTLRSRMQASPLMDAPGFARNIEAAYRQAWRTWCQT